MGFSTSLFASAPLHPLFGFPSVLYTVRVDFQRTSRHLKRPPRFPNRIRELRVKLGMSQSALARAVGRPLSMVCLWERGHRLPTLPHLFRLAKALNTFAEALYPAFYIPRDHSEGSARA